MVCFLLHTIYKLNNDLLYQHSSTSVTIGIILHNAPTVADDVAFLSESISDVQILFGVLNVFGSRTVCGYLKTIVSLYHCVQNG